MIVAWTVTNGAVWNWTYYSFTGDGTAFGDQTVEGDTATARTQFYTTSGTGETLISENSQAANETGTYETSFIGTTTANIRSTTTAFDEENGIYGAITSASYDTANSQIVTFLAPTTTRSGITRSTVSSVLSLTTGGTYLRPLAIPDWIDVNVGDGAYAPTIIAWSSAVGYTHPAGNANNTSLANGLDLAHSGRITANPNLALFQAPSATTDFPAFFTETRQSDLFTWTLQTQTATTLTRAEDIGNAPITKSTQSFATTVPTTTTTSGSFVNSFATVNVGIGTASALEWWDSTTMVAQTFFVGTGTVAGSVTTTQLASATNQSYIRSLSQNQEGQLPLAVFLPDEGLRGVLRFGRYSHFHTHNVGFAFNSSQNALAAISHSGDSFKLPNPAFSTALLQYGVSAPLPFQTRSSTSSNSTTLWSLGVSRLSMTTASKNSSTSGQTTSSYGLRLVGTTARFSSSRVVTGTGVTAAGGYYPSESFLFAGGVFTATAGNSQFTGTQVSPGTRVSAFQPLPYLHVEAGRPSVATINTALAVLTGALGLRRLGLPLTA
jgi:hypothetical protein